MRKISNFILLLLLPSLVFAAGSGTTQPSANVLKAEIASTATGKGAALVGFKASGAGAVARTVLSKSQEIISVRDFGAMGDGVADDTAAIQAAVNRLGSIHGGVLFLPAGIYNISSQINIATDAVTIKGEGAGEGNSGASLNGATVIRTTVASNFVNVATAINNLSIQDLYINSAVASGAALAVTGSGSINNLSMRNVFVQGMDSALYISSGGSVVHGQVEFCQFGYNTGNHITIENGGDVQSLVFLSTRFEPAGSGKSLFKATGSSLATGSIKFINCVFESASAAVAVDIGDNAVAFSFIGCHFENNASPISGVPVSSGNDIKIGGGQSSVLVEGCVFSFPHSSATGFYNISNQSGAVLTAINNTVNGMGHAGYLGFVADDYGVSSTLIGNKYIETGSPWIDYAAGITSPSRVADWQKTLKAGAVVGPIVKYIQTTDATATRIWGALYQFQPSSAVYAVADIVGTDSTGAVYAAFTIRQLFSVDTTNAVTSRGAANETGIVSGAQSAAFVATGTVGTAGLELRVTGVSGTNIKWSASVTLYEVGF